MSHHASPVSRAPRAWLQASPWGLLVLGAFVLAGAACTGGPIERAGPLVGDAADAAAPGGRDGPASHGDAGDAGPGPDDGPTADGGGAGSDAGPADGARVDASSCHGLTAAQCFAPISGSLNVDYDRYHPVMNCQCKGTNHQDITGVERLVFLGDSVTVGTPPTPVAEFYRTRLTEMVKAKFPGVAVSTCADWGARTDDFLENSNQIPRCFSGPEPRRTLIIFTMGANDISEWAKAQLTVDDAMVQADLAADKLVAALTYLTAPVNFPNGSYVIFGNPYEYTDATGDLLSCPAASLSGLTGNWLQGAPAVLHLQERYIEAAVDLGVDMVFTLETFCGHGYHRNDTSSQCYRGPNAEMWFDLTCLHPTPAGHAVIADLFWSVIEN